MADFSPTNVTLSADANTVTLTGQATAPVPTAVTVTTIIQAADGSGNPPTDTVVEQGSRLVTKGVPTTIKSVSDNIGGHYTIAADGQSAQQG